jgi:hypothetical protein
MDSSASGLFPLRGRQLGALEMQRDPRNTRRANELDKGKTLKCMGEIYVQQRNWVLACVYDRAGIVPTEAAAGVRACSKLLALQVLLVLRQLNLFVSTPSLTDSFINSFVHVAGPRVSP